MNQSYIHPDAKIGKDVTIEPFAYIAGNVEIGDGCWIGPHATILDNVKIGKNCKIYPGAIIGGEPQDYKFSGEVTYVEIGDNTILREYVTVNRGTLKSGRGVTKVGNGCMIMSYSHIAHDCIIADNVVLVSYVGIAGVTDVDEYAIIGGHSAAHQFTRIGAHSMLSGGSMVGKDVPPYIVAGRRPLSFGGVNVIGLRRRGFSNDKIDEIRDIYKVIYNGGLNTSDACNEVDATFAETPEKRAIVDFIRSSKRGIIRGGGKSIDE
ncbi:MAG: acyl-[acyl-carrier-protein]--UDP-N-acetylglucosamine O-acyltransferase [Bacteroidetes bacterium GWF2_41_61]|jgi:UDP-N-acetylglucosamine acyltransferase|nr:MAG: acyl-[acyl-carrier-protein]--UDP-N-acetylglucosamine O-acyltransferase [Bacteroidetes bacterium GWE2_40_15]OFY28447.1 MAG: acyl-[acyl-carrier-protein]--UDP-N-acetylglucosamine O-acyltransferase [Bacteroidetes bacterium GWF2_41_61]OFY91846.1 MAG: acyl-[acyl-carrier-protein]--UDP-N-acetylglucosamine O-acyltransferase [Bacteroidetes bacterium RIFOXYA12_FULL_40_10]PKP06537.1 MAG: acyl-[acyl-carrier-protein]--UDP-N-acetylglucosamine O-acyltransferase [Bacteroidetes bacterium HGW-Bacteroidetes